MRKKFLCQFTPCCYQTDCFKRLLRHTWDKHALSPNFKYICNISSCTRSYTNCQSFRRHLKSSHTWFYETNFQTENKDLLEDEADRDGVLESDIDSSEITLDDIYDDLQQQDDLNYDDIIAEFLLELRETFNVTTDTTCFISEKLQTILNIDRAQFSKLIKSSLEKNQQNFEMDYETKTILLSESLFSRSCSRFIGKKALTQYIKKKACYVEPQEVAIGFDEIKQKNDTVQYIPVLETLKIVMSHEDVLGTVLQSRQSTNGRLYSFNDGAVYKGNKLFSAVKNALELVLYHDDFNVINPLGNKVSKYKVSAFYFVIGNLPSKYRCRLKDIHLAVLSPASLIKKYGYASILDPLLKDLKILEAEGINISIDNIRHTFFGTVSMMVADNLAAHAIGGFYCNFSTVKRFCRFCLAVRTSLNDTCQSELRTVESYQNQISSVEIDPSLCSTYGLLKNSCLNSLEYYHVTNGLPPDLAHDVLEGFAKDISKNVIVHYIKEKSITLEDLNATIISFPYSEVDKKNKPQPIHTQSLATLKNKQTASEMWNFLRLLPFYIGNLIPANDERWINFITFLDIVDRLCAPSFSGPELIVLSHMIDEFFEVYLELYPDEDLKPKTHFIRHYPEMIRKFGPLIKTLRFESKNGQMKSFANNNKNKKNLCQSLAKKHQMLMYLSYKETFLLEKRKSQAIGSLETTVECLVASDRELIENVCSVREDSMLIEAKAIIEDGHRYSRNEAVILDFVDDEYVFGKILKVFIVDNVVYLMCNVLVTECYNSHFHAYEVCDGYTNMLVEINKLFDYHPLGLYKLLDRFYVIMRYHVPFE